MINPEYIPDNDSLYRRIPGWWYVAEEGRIDPAAFYDKKASVDWEKYSTPQETAARAGNKNKFSVAAIKSQIPRKINLEVRHTPSNKNDLHSSIIGKKRAGKAKHLADNCELVLKAF